MTEINHIGTQPIETERLLLRRFIAEDAEPMFTNWANDPEVTRYLTWEPHGHMGNTRTVLGIWLNDYKINPDNYNWAIVLKETGQPIGSIGFGSFSVSHRKAEVGYCISRGWWGRGIMTEALNAVVAFAFQEIGLNRVQAIHDVHNPASGRVMQKAGMRYEGRVRQSIYAKGIFHDCALYAILREDWEG